MIPIIFLLAVGCLDPTNSTFNTEHFIFFYAKPDERKIKEMADSVEGSYARIVGDLRCQGMRKVTIHFYPSQVALWAAIKPWNPKPSAWTTGTTLGDSVIDIISPNAPGQNYMEMLRSTIHEFAHCVSRHINFKIVNNPRWLWESIAIYESGQVVDPKTLPYLVNHHPPSLKQLNDWSDTSIYDVGYFICQYLVETNGSGILNTLIKNNGEIQGSLHVADDAFTERWFAFVRRKYGF